MNDRTLFTIGQIRASDIESGDVIRIPGETRWRYVFDAFRDGTEAKDYMPVVCDLLDEISSGEYVILRVEDVPTISLKDDGSLAHTLDIQEIYDKFVPLYWWDLVEVQVSTGRTLSDSQATSTAPATN